MLTKVQSDCRVHFPFTWEVEIEMKKRKLKPTDIIGKEAEERFITLARSLKSPSFVRSVTRASSTLDKYGVDIIIHLHSLCGGKDIKVPIQVKSSV